MYFSSFLHPSTKLYIKTQLTSLLKEDVQISLQNGIRLFYFYFTQSEWESETMTIKSRRKEDSMKVFGGSFPLSTILRHQPFLLWLGRGDKVLPEGTSRNCKITQSRHVDSKKDYIILCEKNLQFGSNRRLLQ